MPVWLLSTFTFVKANATILVIAAAVTVVSILGLKLVKTIQNEATQEVTISFLRKELQDKQEVIDYQVRIMNLQDVVSKNAQNKINELNAQLDNGLTERLGKDEGDLAPESIRELMRRLNEGVLK